MTKHKGLTRSITRKQARSYARLRPNGIGVTAIAAVNGPGARKLAKARVARSVKRHGPKSAHTKRARRLARAVRNPSAVRIALAEARQHAHVAAHRSRRTAKKIRTRAAANPRRPPRGWFKKCVAGVKRSGSAVEPRAVCGATWARKTVSQKRTALAAYEANARKAPMRKRKKPTKAEYKRRYARTQAILQRPRKPRASRKRIHGIPPLFVGGGFPVIVPPAPRRRARARKATTETPMARRKSKKRKGLAGRTPAQRAAFKRMMKGLAKYQRSLGGRPAKRRRYASNPKRKAKGGRSIGGYRRVIASVGGRKVPTYLYRSKRGKLKHIPMYALLGAKSRTQVKKIFAKGGKAAERVQRRITQIRKTRERAATRVSRHGGVFTPNRRGIVVPYETWSASMSPNRQRKRGSRKAAKRPKIHRGTHRSRSAAAKKAARTRAKKHEIRSRAAKKAARTRRARGRHRKNARGAMIPNRRRRSRARRRYTDNRRRHGRKHYADNRRRRSRKRYASNRRRRSYATLPARGPFYANRRRHRRNRRRRTSTYLPVRIQRLTPNRRHRRHYASNRRRHRRHYESNPFSGRNFIARLKGMLKVGALVAVGFGAHRALTKLVSDQVLGQIGAFQTGTLATYRGLISGLLVGSAGIYAADAVFKKNAGEINSGIFASFVHSLLTTVLNAAGQQTIAAALSAYPDAEGRAYHGLGEYMPVQGFGAYEMVSGLGAAPMLSQAAAGFGDIPTRGRYGRSSTIAQAAAGFGASPMLSQAAAGTGEYMAQGIEGIGDYEMVAGVGSLGGMGAMDNGIPPNLHAAEHALNIAEAAAGLGDIGTASTLNPMMIAQPISDAPEGMRAGILQGGDGIFG